MVEREAIKKGLDEPLPRFEANVNVFMYLHLYMPLHMWTGGREVSTIYKMITKEKMREQTTHSSSLQ